MTTWWFWLVVVETVLLFTFLAYDKGTAATISLVAFMAGLYWLGGVDFITYAKDYPIRIFYGALIYFPVGIIWAIFKWFMLVLDKKDTYKDFKIDFLKRHRLPLRVGTPMNQDSVDAGLITKETLEEWKGFRQSHHIRIPQVGDHKYRILRWLGYWPVNMVWTLISDFLKRISKWIFNLIRGILQSISDWTFKDLKADLE